MLGHQVAPGDGHDLREHGLGNIRQMVAHPHQGQDIGDVRSRHPQNVGLFKNAQGFELVFKIFLRNARQQGQQFLIESGPARG